MTFVIKALIWILFLFIFFALGSALYYLVSSKHNSDKVIKALTWRIGLSVLLFVILFIAFSLGWIAPHPM